PTAGPGPRVRALLRAGVGPAAAVLRRRSAEGPRAAVGLAPRWGAPPRPERLPDGADDPGLVCAPSQASGGGTVRCWITPLLAPPPHHRRSRASSGIRRQGRASYMRVPIG